MAAMQDGEVAQQNILAILERDRLVRDARVFSDRTPVFPSAQALAPNEPRPIDGNILQVLAPDQAIVPMAMTVILVLVPRLIRLRGIVGVGSAGRRIGAHDGGTI